VLAVEEGPHGVRSNVIAPGPIGGTEGMDRLSGLSLQTYIPPFLIDSFEPPKGKRADGSSVEIKDEVPLGRIGDVRDVAHATVFLFSDAASWVTGQVFVVDGGHEHLRTLALPYPTSVLEPEKVKKMMAARL
jgi:2,4-dienoyl-CoA reductase [(3E)-enoyl-CoA-producing], peroxisomal